MPQYDNPAAFLPQPQDFMSGGLQTPMSGFAAALRQQQAAPFLEQLLQQQQMNTSQQQTQLQEFQSPQGQAVRQSERQKVIDQGNIFHQTMQDEVNKSHEAARLLPHATDQQIQEAMAHTQNAKHLIASEPSTYFTGIYPFIEQMKKSGATDEQIAPIYNQFVKNSGYDVSKMDDDVKEWKPSTFGALAAHRIAQIATPDQIKKLQQEDVPAQAQRDVAKINAKSRMDEMSAQIKAGRFQNDQAMVASIEKSLRTGKDADSGEPLDEAARTELKGQLQRYKSSKLLDYVNKQTTMEQLTKMMATMSGDPEKARLGNQTYEEAVNKAREQGLKIMGMSPEDVGAPAKSKFKVGQTISVQGSNVQVVGVNPDGSARIKDPKTGRTGTYRQ